MALLNFQEKNDTKAAILVFIAYSSGPVSSIMAISQSIEINEGLQLVVGVGLYYDAPNPSQVYDEFLAIPTISGNASTSSFSDFVQSMGHLIDDKGLRLVVQSAVGWDVVNPARLASSQKMPRSRNTQLLFSIHL